MASANDKSDKDREVDDFMTESGGRMYEPSADDAVSEHQNKKRKNANNPEVRKSVHFISIKS